MWFALASIHESFAETVDGARRYQPDVSVFSAIEDRSAERWEALARLVGPAGSATLTGTTPFDIPSGWTVGMAARGHQMVLAGEMPERSSSPPATRPLAEGDVPAMLALVELAKPGPFRPRTIELGEYHGIFDGGRLVAMAGQRIHAPGFTEISAVCTHPQARRRGYGAVVTETVARRILARGETPFLHVAEGNDNARRVYERLGFVTRLMTNFVIVAAPA